MRTEAHTISTSRSPRRATCDIGSGFNDDPLWLIAGTAAYIKETGDYTILDEMVPFDNDESKATAAHGAPDAAPSTTRWSTSVRTVFR